MDNSINNSNNNSNSNHDSNFDKDGVYSLPLCSNGDSIRDTFRKHRGDMVLMDGEVLQFVAIADDDNDYLYVFYNGRELRLFIILSNFVVIKGKIDNRDYNYFIRNAKLNYHSAMLKNEKFKEHHIYIQEYLDKLPSSIENIRYLSEFDWSLDYIENEDGTIEDMWNTDATE